MTDAATKAAINHMTKRLALSLALQMRVHVIAPSLVDTPMSQAWTTAHKR
ncbi:MAG TPA: SDR family NAD(P)-dependent oxidoreductase [Crinalium sp.]